MIQSGIGEMRRVLIASAEEAYSERLCAEAHLAKGWSVTGCCAQVSDLGGTISEHSPDVLILDLEMPGAHELGSVLENLLPKNVRPVVVGTGMKDILDRKLQTFGFVDIFVQRDAPFNALVGAIEEILQINSSILRQLTHLASAEATIWKHKDASEKIDSQRQSPAHHSIGALLFAVLLGVTSLVIISDRMASSSFTNNRIGLISQNLLVLPNTFLALREGTSQSLQDRIQTAVQDYISSRPSHLRDVPPENLRVDEVSVWNVSPEDGADGKWLLAFAHIVQVANGMRVEGSKVTITLRASPELSPQLQVVRISKNLYPDAPNTSQLKLGTRFGTSQLREHLGPEHTFEFIETSLRKRSGQWQAIEKYFVPNLSAYALVASNGEIHIEDAKYYFGPEDLTVSTWGNPSGSISPYDVKIVPLEGYPYLIECNQINPITGDPTLLGFYDGLSGTGGKLFSAEALTWLGRKLPYADECWVVQEKLRTEKIDYWWSGENPLPYMQFFISPGKPWWMNQNEILANLHYTHRPVPYRQLVSTNVHYYLQKANRSSVLRNLKATRHDLGVPKTKIELIDDESKCYAATTSQTLEFVNNSNCEKGTDSIVFHEFFHLLHIYSTQAGRSIMRATAEAVADIFSAYMTQRSCIMSKENGRYECRRDISGQYLVPQNTDIESVTDHSFSERKPIDPHVMGLPLSSAYWEVRNIPGIDQDLAAEIFLGVALKNPQEQLMDEFFLSVMDLAKILLDRGERGFDCSQFKGVYRAFLKRGFVKASWGPETFDPGYYFDTCPLEPQDINEFSEPPVASSGDERVTYLDTAFRISKHRYYLADCDGSSGPCWNIVYIDWDEGREVIPPAPQRRFDGSRAAFFHESPAGSGIVQHGWVSQLLELF